VSGAAFIPASLLESNDFKALQHPYRTRSCFVVRANQPERTLVAEQCFFFSLVSHKNFLIGKCRIQLAEREHDFITVIGLRKNITGEGFPEVFLPTERRPG